MNYDVLCECDGYDNILSYYKTLSAFYLKIVSLNDDNDDTTLNPLSYFCFSLVFFPSFGAHFVFVSPLSQVFSSASLLLTEINVQTKGDTRRYKERIKKLKQGNNRQSRRRQRRRKHMNTAVHCLFFFSVFRTYKEKMLNSSNSY